MKQKTCVSLIGILIITISMMFTVTACKPATNNSSPKPVATYTGTMGESKYVIVFYDDKTVKMNMTIANQNQTIMMGVYTGNPATDGSIQVTVKKALKDDGKLHDLPAEEQEAGTIVITNGTFILEGITFKR